MKRDARRRKAATGIGSACGSAFLITVMAARCLGAGDTLQGTHLFIEHGQPAAGVSDKAGNGPVLLPPRLRMVAGKGVLGELAAQRLIVERTRDGVFIGDVSRSARFSSSNPRVAAVSRDGVVRPLAPGRITITARVGGALASASVVVESLRPDRRSPSFRSQVEPVLTKMGCNSGACHGALAGKGGMKLTLRGYDPEADHAVLTRQTSGRRICLPEPAQSLMLLKPTATIAHGGGQRFRPDALEYRLLSSWIAAGAPAPRADDPHMVGLEVFPPTSVLRKGDSQQIVVRARFSDGHAEDVTRWVKYGTSDAGVATTGDDGQVVVQGPGEAAITIWYLSQVAFARITSPFPQSGIQVFRYSGVQARASQRLGNAAPEHATTRKPEYLNTERLIDSLVDRKLQALNLPASGPASDAEFLRRAYLDATGILPTAAEVERFLASSDRDKRRKTIDALLDRPEYVEYWVYKWSDLLLVSTRTLPSLSMRAFYGWIRQSVAENKRWDRFAREIVTASGSTLENGAANYFVLHRDPVDLTETTTQAFLGMSLTCARCHNHPMEKWTQKQYYAMANLYARVARKSGDSGETIVYTASSGEVRHPRTGQALPPQPLDGQAMSLDAPDDRREHLAAWLTSPQNPYFARAIVNRVWRQFMGRGLVEAEDDLRLTNPPSNEELMAALTADFVRHGFDLKRLIRSVMNSATYQRSSTPVAGNEQDQKYYSHYIVRRLPAEVILDALSQVTGVPTEFAGYPAGWRALQLPDSQVDSYFLTAFGRPERAATCSCERQQEPSVAQALHLANGDTVNKKLKSDAGIIPRMVEEGIADDEVLRRLYLSALSRFPTTAEREALLPALAAAPVGADPKMKAARRHLIEDLYWATVTGREFLFNR